MPGDNAENRPLAPRSAARQIDSINSDKELRYEALYAHLRQYILIRFCLDDEPCETDDLIELAELSLAKVLHIRREELCRLDLSSCTRSSYVVTRKNLLFLVLEKELGIEILPEENASITDIGDLAELILAKLKKKQLRAKGRMLH